MTGEDPLKDFPLPYTQVSVITITEDRSAVILGWWLDQGRLNALLELLGEPHGEGMLDAEHVMASYLAGRGGLSVYAPGDDQCTCEDE